MGGRSGRGAELSAGNATAWRICADDLSHPDVLALLVLHARAAHVNSPPDSAFALDLSGLSDPAVRFWTIWEGDAVLGMGALERLGARGGGGQVDADASWRPNGSIR